jgi:hypothetical protein
LISPLLKYRNFIVLALIALLAVPCSIKRELKQSLQPESHQQIKTTHQQIVCSGFYQEHKQDKRRRVEKQILPYSIFKIQLEHQVLAKTIELPNFYFEQKEKIPAYILFERFLI